MAGAAVSQGNQPAAGADPVAELKARLLEVRSELSRVQGFGSGAQNPPPGATAVEVEEYRTVVESLVRAYQEHLDRLGRLESARRRISDLEQQLRSWSGFSTPPPYSILLVDELRDSVESLVTRIAASESALKTMASLTDDAAVRLAKSDEQLRLLAERLEASTDNTMSLRLAWERSLEQMRNRQLMARAALSGTQRRRLESELAEHRLRLLLVRRQLAVAAAHVRFSESDLEGVLAGLDREMREVSMEIPAAEKELQVRQQELTTAREAVAKHLESAGGGPDQGAAGSAVVDKRLTALQENVDRLGARAEASSQRLIVLRQLADLTVNERGLWRMRYAAFHTRDLDRLRDGFARLDEMRRLVRSVKPHFQQEVALAERLIANQRIRVEDRGQTDASGPGMLLEAYRERAEMARRALSGLEKLERLADRWMESLEADRQKLPFLDRLRDLSGGASSVARKLWDFELFAAEDTIVVDGQSITGRRTVTVGKVVSAVLILALGYWLSSIIARGVDRLAVSRFGIEPNHAQLIRRWARVVTVMVLVVLSLVLVKIPLTVFAFLGGALAIGLGFGTQNLLKNFISGIIILLERPFRVGDVLNISGQCGTVISIGIRSSVLRLFDNTETLIPNSALLENNLTNWTYSDRKVRFAVSVGVAYGSDTRQVSRALAEAAAAQRRVQKDPAPQVLLLEFAESALTFEVRYWVDVVHHNAADVGSELRHTIASQFATEGIVMAFPQRDIHVDIRQPVPVQVMPSREPVGTLPSPDGGRQPPAQG